jgi:hypothetical protein
MGKRGPETERSPVGAVVVVLTGAPRCEATRQHAVAPTAPGASAGRNGGGVVAPMDPQRPCWQVLASLRCV